MHWNIMSTITSVLHEALPFILAISLPAAIRIVLTSAAGCAMLVLFKPLLTGLLRAFVLLVKPKLSKEERLARAQYSIRWP